jgi:N6-adenosine-specific RNA methylase IME4
VTVVTTCHGVTCPVTAVTDYALLNPAMQTLLIPPQTPSIFEPLPAQTYEVIYADPPWQYRDASKNRGGAERHYPTVKIEDLMRLPVAQIAEENAVLALWATWPTLPDAIALIQAWGFTYKTCLFCWVKTAKNGTYSIGGGAYTRANSEPCLLATRGSTLTRYSRSVRQIIESGEPETLVLQRGKHSAKPPEARDRIVELFQPRSKIELFARTAPTGWDVWGNESAPKNHMETPGK